MEPRWAQAAGEVVMVHGELVPFSFERAWLLRRLAAWRQARARRAACASQPSPLEVHTCRSHQIPGEIGSLSRVGDEVEMMEGEKA